MATTRAVAGVDSSTQSTKVEVRELSTGRVLGRSSSPHPATHPPRSEQDPNAWWHAFEQAFEAAWGAATSAADGELELAGISVGGQQHGMVALDADGAVIRPAKLWNDTETAPDAGWLVKQLPGGAADWAAAVGSVPVAAFTATKLSWLHRSEADSWARLAHVVLPHDWMTYRLTGNLVTDRGDASGTGYWSPASGEYRWDLLGIIDGDRDWTTVVPRVAGPRETVGEWRGAPVACGTGDNMAAALGLGLTPGTAVVSLGTSGTAYARASAPSSDPTGAVAGFADATGGFLPLVCTLNATKVTDTVARLLGLSRDEFDAAARSVAVGAGGITVLPWFDGERTPDKPKATGWLTGVRNDATREELARAAVEGVCCSMLDALDALAEVAPVERVVLVGGGARSAAYRHAFASLCPLPVAVADAEEAVATGACVQAAVVATGRSHDDVAAEWHLGTVTPVEVEHDADVAAAVRGRYALLARRCVVTDPYATLGVPESATLDELTSARRRLAMTLHPDVGGDAAAMQAVNTAYDEAVRRLSQQAPPPQPAPRPTRLRPQRGVQYDSPSFTIDVLPVEAYEALLVVTSWMGEVLVDDPPYVLEVFLHDPSPCWCRLDLVPDAGATTVSLMVAGIDPDPTPDPELVRDEFVANLNRLGDV